MKKDTSDYIFFEKNGILREVTKPEYGEVLIKYKAGQPYDVQVTTNIELNK
ncbi:hypothetical protein [Streptococcus uberis]|uniref:hypothetical protein n=1 Tax=Streptococcus uberis TaxID=1349 RepID=UPI001FF3552C|nr:hypothetical protein [Streptococcus uberis]MCK1215242.1 hypothetical protein [Streptococcus uberis]